MACLCHKLRSLLSNLYFLALTGDDNRAPSALAQEEAVSSGGGGGNGSGGGSRSGDGFRRGRSSQTVVTLVVGNGSVGDVMKVSCNRS